MHMARFSLCLKDVVQGATVGGSDAISAAAEQLVKEDERLQTTLESFRVALSVLWAVPEEPAKVNGSAAVLQGWELRVGTEGLVALNVRALTWGVLCLPAWMSALSAVPASKKTPQNITDAVSVAKNCVRNVKTCLTDFSAAALKITKHADSKKAASYSKEHPEVLLGIDEAGGDRAAVVKSVTESRGESIKQVRAMLTKRQELLKAAGQR